MSAATGGAGVVGKLIASSLVVPPRATSTSTSGRAADAVDPFDPSFAALLDQLRLIKQIDELWDARVSSGQLAYDASDETEIQGYYQDWLETADRVATEAKLRPTPDLPLVHEAEFLDRLEAVRGICTPDEVFFAGPALVELKDRAVDAFLAGETVEFREMGE